MSELLVNTIKKADGTGSLTVPAESGTVVTTASPSLGRRNLILNGSMAIAQRGTSATSSAYNTVDRFRPYFSGVAVTTTQNALTSGSPYDEGHRYSMKLANTSTSSATNGFARIFQVIEAQNVAQSGWNYKSSSADVTLSFWAKSSLAGTYYCSFLSNDGTARNYASSYTLSADTWKKVTITVSGDANLTFNTDNGIGLYVYWVIDEGGDYSDSGFTLDQWGNLSVSSQVPDFPQHWNQTASATFEITGVQLEVGSVATPFEHRSYGEELALCQRYYEVLKDTTVTNGVIGNAAYYNSSLVFLGLKFEHKRTNSPSLEQTTVANGYTFERSGATDDFNSWTGMLRTTASTAQLYVDSGVSGTAGQAGLVWTRNSNTYIAIEDEL